MLGWARRNPLAIWAAGMLAAVLALNVGTLTTAPPPYGDEAWIASTVDAFVSGDGFYPTFEADYGVYDNEHDLWAAKLGAVPQVLAGFVGPMTLGFHRAVSLLTGLAALAVFWFGLRRLHGAVGATFATAALAATWGFFSASHYIRWDPVGIVVAAAVLALLLAGPPRPRTCLALGLLVGLALDFAYSLAGVLPGIALLALWEPGDRARKLGALAAGVAIGALVFLALHILPDPDLAQEQYDTAYKPSYGEAPILDAIGSLSLQPLLDESDRYELLLQSSLRPSIMTLLIGLVAAVIALLAAARAGRRWLVPAGVSLLAVAGAAMLAHHFDLYLNHPEALDVLRYTVFVLIGTGLAALALLLLNDRPRYPRHAVAAILLLSLLVGYGLLQAYKAGTHTAFAMPFAVAVVLAAAEQLVSEARRPLTVAAIMTVFTFAGGTFIVESASEAEPEPAVDDEIARIAQEIVPPGRTVMGEHVYWWLYRDERYRANTAIWFQQYTHPEYDFFEAFDAIKPDYVLLDDRWLARYLDTSWSEVFPNEAPSDPRERGWLMDVLRSEYREVERLEFGGRTLAFWERRELGADALAEGCGRRPQAAAAIESF